MSSPSESSLKIDRESPYNKPIAAISLSPAKKIVACEDGLEVYQFGGVELVCLEGLQVAGRDHKQTCDQDGKEIHHRDGIPTPADIEKEAVGVVDTSISKQGGICGFSTRLVVVVGTVLLLLIAASFHFLFVFLTRGFN
jgi:hypothetical protein